MGQKWVHVVYVSIEMSLESSVGGRSVKAHFSHSTVSLLIYRSLSLISLEGPTSKEAKEKEAWERRKNYDPLGRPTRDGSALRYSPLDGSAPEYSPLHGSATSYSLLDGLPLVVFFYIDS
jgi:hypothetical protein